MGKIKLYKPQKKYVYAFHIFMPLIVFALGYIMYEDKLLSNWKYPAICCAIMYPVGFISWYIQVQYEMWLREKFSELYQVWQRIIAKVLANIFIMTPSVMFLFYLFDYFKILDYSIKPDDLKSAYLVGLIFNLSLDTLWEAIFTIDKYKESLSKKELVEQLKLQQEFDQIKQKLNPHFLFNCFNALSTLIAEDKNQAEVFLNNMSTMYRYILKNNEEDFVPLENELNFLKSYYSLLKTRHGHALRLEVDIDSKYYSSLVPSLGLQLLIENAVKHNIVSKTQPLDIKITIKGDDKLEVKNNLQLKEQKENSTKIGLESIKSKYDLINHHTNLSVNIFEEFYAVQLPLLNK